MMSLYYVIKGSLMLFFFFKQKTAYELRISDWSSDVCSSDLTSAHHRRGPVCRRISLRTRAAIDPLIDFRNARVIGVCFGLRERGDIQTNHAEPSGSVATSLGLSNAQAKKAVDAVIAGAAAKGEKRPSMASASSRPGNRRHAKAAIPRPARRSRVRASKMLGFFGRQGS